MAKEAFTLWSTGFDFSDDGGQKKARHRQCSRHCMYGVDGDVQDVYQYDVER